MIAAVFLWLKPPLPQSQPQVSPSPTDQLESISYKNKTYRFAYFTVIDPARLRLVVNNKFEDTKTLIDRYQCRSLTNGGFYDENNRPLGWLVSDGRELSAPIESKLFDGFLAVNDKVTISFDLPRSARAGLQSGPILIFETKPLALAVANDELRRRIVALLTKERQLIFLTVVGQDSEIAGPHLADLPGLVEAIAAKLDWQVSEALNLDGGTASAFYADKVYLKELNPVGSVFCYN